MEKQGRSVRTLAVIALLIAVIGMSVGFAALQQALTITGTTTVRGATWNVEFQNLSTPTLGSGLTGEAKVDTPAALSNGSTTMTYAVSLYQPGDQVVYNVDVRNTGTINAKVSSINLTGVSAALTANVTYTLTYQDGTEILVNDTLDVNQSRTLRLTVTYNNVTEVPDTDIPLSLGATITYIQA